MLFTSPFGCFNLMADRCMCHFYQKNKSPRSFHVFHMYEHLLYCILYTILFHPFTIWNSILKAYSSSFDEFLHPDGQSMDYNEVINAFSNLVETHFLQRCPPVDSLGATVTTTSSSGTPESSANTTPQSAQPESHPDCYKLPQIHLSGERLPLVCTYFVLENSNTL